MKVPRLYTALDNPKDSKRFTFGVERLYAHGVRPYQVFVYMLIGYWPNETQRTVIDTKLSTSSG